MPADNLLKRRDRAVFAMLLLTALRADTLASLTLGSVDLDRNYLWLDSRIVRTKDAKSFTVFLLPFFPKARAALEAWIAELRALGLSSSDALFPRDTGLDRAQAGEPARASEYAVWQGSSQVRAIILNAFKSAELPAQSPHVFRHMNTMFAMSMAPPIDKFVAFSINLGHTPWDDHNSLWSAG